MCSGEFCAQKQSLVLTQFTHVSFFCTNVSLISSFLCILLGGGEFKTPDKLAEISPPKRGNVFAFIYCFRMVFNASLLFFCTPLFVASYVLIQTMSYS